MQHYGKFRDEEKAVTLTETEAYDMIVPLNKELKSEYQKAEEWLRDFFGD
jgi:osomolarity two-component system phosphorelay intermediate protein YPD1